MTLAAELVGPAFVSSARTCEDGKGDGSSRRGGTSRGDGRDSADYTYGSYDSVEQDAMLAARRGVDGSYEYSYEYSYGSYGSAPASKWSVAGGAEGGERTEGGRRRGEDGGSGCRSEGGSGERLWWVRALGTAERSHCGPLGKRTNLV